MSLKHGCGEVMGSIDGFYSVTIHYETNGGAFSVGTCQPLISKIESEPNKSCGRVKLGSELS